MQRRRPRRPQWANIYPVLERARRDHPCDFFRSFGELCGIELDRCAGHAGFCHSYREGVAARYPSGFGSCRVMACRELARLAQVISAKPNLCRFAVSTTMVIIGCARSELSIESVLRSGSLIPWLGFSSMTRNGNARANFFKKPAHVEKDCFSPEPLSFEMPYH